MSERIESVDNIKRVVKGKIVGMVTGGKSIEELESRIEEFKDLPIVWASMNRFDMMEKAILGKVNKHFTVISDCATVGFEKRNKYEREIRFPKFEEFLLRNEDNVLLTSHIVINQAFVELNRGDLYTKYKRKFSIIEELFESTQDRPAQLWRQAPNSITLAFAGLIAGQAKKIIVFGMDGFAFDINMTTEQILNSYYRSDAVKHDRLMAFGSETSGNLVGDTVSFNKKFDELHKTYQSVYHNPCEIVNCSPNSHIDVLRKISYDDLKDEI